jgi:hypothetical protein
MEWYVLSWGERMKRIFFIGGNKFYTTEVEATADLEEFIAQFNIPKNIFCVVGLDVPDEKAEQFKETRH